MSQGLQVWDENGKTVLDTSTDTVKILGVYKGNVNTSIKNPLFKTERFFYVVSPAVRYPDTRKGGQLVIDVRLTGDTCYIKNIMGYEGGEPAASTIFIGVY